MLANFSDAFIKKPLFTGKPSDALIEALNMELPEGCEYEYSGEKDICYIKTQGAAKIEGMQLKIPEEIMAVLDKNTDPSHLMALLYQYQYNMGKSLEVTVSENAMLNLENGAVPLDKMVISPMHEAAVENGRFEMFPELTVQRRRLTLSDGQHKIEIELERKPSGVWNEDIYVSVPESFLSINVKLNTIEQQASFNVSVNMQVSQSVDQYISSLYLYNAFQTGKIRINDKPLPVDADSANPVPASAFRFWEGISALQGRIHQTLMLPAQLDNEDIILGGKLICSIIKEKPFKTERNIDLIRFKGSFQERASIRSHIGSEFLFAYSQSGTCELFDATFPIFCCTVIRGGILSDITDVSEAEYIVHFAPPETSKPYYAERYFLSEEAMEAYMKNDQFINQMTHASTLRESLDDEELLFHLEE